MARPSTSRNPEGKRERVGESASVEENYVLWVVERAEGDPTDQVIAVRRRR